MSQAAFEDSILLYKNMQLNRWNLKRRKESFILCITLGPWVIGEMMQGHLGALFVHGMYLKQHWIPGSLTYYYGIMQVRKAWCKDDILFRGFGYHSDYSKCGVSNVHF